MILRLTIQNLFDLTDEQRRELAEGISLYLTEVAQTTGLGDASNSSLPYIEKVKVN